MADSIVNFRVDEELKKAFEAAAKAQDITASQLFRAFMRQTVDEYMRQNAQGDLLKDVYSKGDSRTKGKPKKQATGSVLPKEWRKS